MTSLYLKLIKLTNKIKWPFREKMKTKCHLLNQCKKQSFATNSLYCGHLLEYTIAKSTNQWNNLICKGKNRVALLSTSSVYASSNNLLDIISLMFWLDLHFGKRIRHVNESRIHIKLILSKRLRWRQIVYGIISNDHMLTCKSILWGDCCGCPFFFFQILF